MIHREIEALADNWAQSDEVALDKPLGEIQSGWDEIKPVYEKIINGSAKANVEHYDYTIDEGGEIFYSTFFPIRRFSIPRMMT